MPELVTFVKKRAETIKNMKKAGWITDEDMELVELAGLNLDGEVEDQGPFEILEPREYGRKPRRTRRPKKSAKEPHKTPEIQSNLILLSTHVKTKQDRLRP